MTTTDKIAQSTMILVLSRLAMLVTPVMLGALGLLFWTYIGEIRADASTAAESAASLNIRTTSLEARASTIEGNQTRGREERIKAQDDLSRAIGKLTDVIVLQGQQIAALTATIEALKVQRR
ncbi:hypothetical protein C3941_23745 [Kaistia algarum]|uniref:hypothetical protein n=1 Tax=Kaistia algarum TaxID=2083279 RepID=UPI000CE91BAF|nr:hypothetical protein [Kaistia algarum]MCX5513405.1 hypothetical protein [Kaistia algarum]PPE77412.1 hypothetical protein C3941_23745 [Kaistia algarum]